MNSNITRRAAVQLLGLGSVAVYLSSCTRRPFSTLGVCPQTEPFEFSSASPIDRTIADEHISRFFGDDVERSHSLLLGRAYEKSPLPCEEVPLVVVGGGMSGLLTSYLLRKHRPVLLEHASRFGGNSKGQSWKGVDYSIGAAYFVKPEPDSQFAELLSELGVDREWTVSTGESFEVQGKIHNGYWHQSDGHLHGKGRVGRYLQGLQDGTIGPYPDIPIGKDDDFEAVAKLDRVSFHDHLSTIAGGALDPLSEKAIEYYCWSSFGASAHEISAAAGINFYAAELGDVVVLPGGNARCAEVLLEKLARSVPQENLRPSSTVLRVERVSEGVLVTYIDREEGLLSLLAKSVVMACPKFVAARLLGDAIEPERKAAIKRLTYRAAVVGNVLIDAPLKNNETYDLYLLGNGKLERKPVAKVTDVICANFSSHGNQHTVLTLYHPFPVEGGRDHLFSSKSYDTLRARFAEISESVLPLFNLSKERIVDIRVARWGHPFPVAAKGLIADRIPYELRKPFKERVFFVNQDNWALPAFETAVTEAYVVAPLVDELLT